MTFKILRVFRLLFAFSALLMFSTGAEVLSLLRHKPDQLN
jgi:hypothetical protein